VTNAQPSAGHPIPARENPRHSLKSKAAAGATCSTATAEGRPSAAATQCHVTTLTGRVLASPELRCASRLTLRRSSRPAKFDLAPVASAPPSVWKLNPVSETLYTLTISPDRGDRAIFRAQWPAATGWPPHRPMPINRTRSSGKHHPARDPRADVASSRRGDQVHHSRPWCSTASG